MVTNLPVNAGAPGWQVEGVVLENHLEKEMAVTQYSCLENSMDGVALWASV